MAGLNRRPYFACRGPMHKQVQLLASYSESTWTPCTHTRTNAHRPYQYRRPNTEQKVEEARLQRALKGSLNTGLMPSCSLCAKGGAGTTNFAGDFYPVMGGGKAAQAPYTVTRRTAPQPIAPATCDLAPSLMISSHACSAHKLRVCVTCKRQHQPAAMCCARGHHAPGYVDRRPLSKVCQAHGLPPCPRCSLMQRGVRHWCQRGHHKVNTLHKGLGKRTALAPGGANNRPRLHPSTLADATMLTTPTTNTASLQATEPRLIHLLWSDQCYRQQPHRAQAHWPRRRGGQCRQLCCLCTINEGDPYVAVVQCAYLTRHVGGAVHMLVFACIHGVTTFVVWRA